MKLTPQILLNAYSQGVFPMGDEDGEIYWFDPDPRAIFPLDAFHVPYRLGRRIRQGGFDVRVDTAFRTVMEICAAPAPGREETWITPEIIDFLIQQHL